jgi:hypothetical protein
LAFEEEVQTAVWVEIFELERERVEIFRIGEGRIEIC